MVEQTARSDWKRLGATGRHLAARVGFAELWLDDDRARTIIDAWREQDGPASHDVQDRLLEEEVRLTRREQALKALSAEGLPWEWLAGEQVDDYYLRVKVALHPGADLASWRETIYAELLEEAARGPDPMPPLEPFRVGSDEPRSTALERLRAWKSWDVASLEGWLLQEAESGDVPVINAIRQDTLQRLRLAGRCYYRARVQRPAPSGKMTKIAELEFADRYADLSSPVTKKALEARRRDIYALVDEAEPFLSA